jgi:hypothetical protein
MLKVIMLSAVMLNIAIYLLFMLNVIMMSAVMLNIVVPNAECHCAERHLCRGRHL